MKAGYIILNMRKAVYYCNDLFEPDKFYRCSEKEFNDTVVRFRDQFKLTYLKGDTQLFEDINSDLKYKRRWL